MQPSPYLEDNGKEIVKGDEEGVLPLSGEIHGKGWILLSSFKVRQNCGRDNISQEPRERL